MVSIHADDFGYDSTVDEQMLKLLRGKKIAGISVLSTMASKVSLRKLAHTVHGRRSPRVSLHVNLTESRKKSDGVGAYCIRPLLPFVFSIFTCRISQKSVEKEIDRQLKILTNAGIKVTAIDSHQHVHALSPVAEAVVAIARKHKIKYIRSYRDVSRFTSIAHIKYRILQIASFMSHVVYHRRLGLPITWRVSGDSMAVMSWEGSEMSSHSAHRTSHSAVTYITHPFLPFDSNLSYMKFLLKGGEHA